MNKYNQFTDWRTPELVRQNRSQKSFEFIHKQSDFRRTIWNFIWSGGRRWGIAKSIQAIKNTIWI